MSTAWVHRVGALIEDPFLVRRRFAADIDDERQVALRQVAADAVDKILAELSLLAQQAHPFRRRFLAPVAFAVGAGAQHVVLNLQRAQSLRQEIGQHRFAAVRRTADHDGGKGVHQHFLLCGIVL